LISLKSQIFTNTIEMKKLIITSILAVLTALATIVRAQDYPREYLGLPGDNLNLYAVMDLFRNSETLEDFERSLNDPDLRINNLDLNGDNFVDYITVLDYVDKKVHTIVLRTLLGRNEYQDVAVFTVHKLHRKKVMIQLIGDAALYGRNYVIEPITTKKRNQRYYGDPVYAENATVINNYYWDYYYGYHSGWNNHYYTYYHHGDFPRYHHYNDFYYHGIRQQSPEVNHRIAEGSYNVTYSKPELRDEGAALYNRRQAAGSNESHRTSAVTGTMGTTSPATVQNTEDRRRSVEATDAGRSDATVTSRRETPSSVAAKNTAVDNRTEDRRSIESRDAERRASELRDAENMEAERRAVESKAAEARESERRAVESRAAEAREAQSRAAESRAAEARESERRAAESKAAESRRSESNTTSVSRIDKPNRRQ
jgi:hypothetical protein